MKYYNNKKIFFLSFVLLFISTISFAQTTPTQKFHDTKGNIEVTKAGQLQYTLNIDLPPGIKEVSPNISLIYNSAGQSGLAGYNWNISGLTSISRTGKNLETDGITKGVQLDYSDYYSFNGQRLILKSGEYGKNNAEYVTEKYSNVKIKSIGALSGVSWQGPEYWEVTFDDGSQAWYGATTSGNSEARSPIDYNIVKSKDINGNYITYNYIIDNNISVISDIQWGGNENQGTQHVNKIHFIFSTRAKPETAYVKGIAFSQYRILSSIIVSTNNTQYRKYDVLYKQDLQRTDYRYLEKITIKNSNNEETNPVVFTYDLPGIEHDPGFGAIFQLQNSTSLKPNSNTDVVGDFDGDGTLDLLRYHSVTSARIPQAGLYLYKNFYSITYNTESPVFITSTLQGLKEAIAVNLKKDNLIYSKQGFVTQKLVINPSTSKKDLELSFYNILENNQLFLNYKRVIPNADYDLSWGTAFNGMVTTLSDIKDVDFNGDGLSELVLQFSDNECHPNPIEGPIISAKPPQTCEYTKRYFVVDLDESIQNNDWYYPLELYPDYDYMDKDLFTIYKAGDFNGDGIFDFLKLDMFKKPLLITFPKNAQNQYESHIAYFNPASNDVMLGIWKDGVVGDYNGDGLSDIMLPENNSSNNWYQYISKGIGFSESTVSFVTIQPNRTIAQNPNGHFYITNPRSFVAYDLNNDGKAELLGVESYRNYIKEYIQDSNQAVKYRRESGVSVNTYSTTSGEYTSAGGIWTSIGGLHNNSIVYLNSSSINGELQVNSLDMLGLSVDQSTGAMIKKIVMTSATAISHDFGNAQNLASFQYFDIARIARIKSILQGGIVTDITYKQLDKVKNPGLYDGVTTMSYPYVEVNQATGMYVVSGLTQTTMSTTKLKQDFRYRGLTSNILGRGMIGFRKTARSSWYADGLENTKIWSGVEIDPLNEGIPIKEWSIRTNNEAQIFPSDVSVNNSQLLNFKSTTYQIDKILNGQVVTTIADADKPKIVTAIVPSSSIGKDFLTNTIAEDTNTYGEYYLPLTNISKINTNYAQTTRSYEYFHNVSGIASDYFIGRPKSTTAITHAYNDSKSGKNEYTYENNRLKTVKNWNNNNSGYLQDTYNYDGFGNITQKIISNSIDAQNETVSTAYDSAGRFVLSKTDNLGLASTFTYNNFGQILTQTDPLQNVITNTYDDWGKLLTLNSNLLGTTTYLYDKDNNSNVTVTQNDPDGNVSKKYTNKLGQEYKVSTKAFGQGQFVSKETQYDILGRKTNESESYFEGQTPNQWNSIAYDDSIFPAKVTITEFTGKQIQTLVSGLTTTATELNGYGRATSKTKDALDNTISTTDPGGTIQFSYDASGQQIKAQYAENIVTTSYDSWGRKSEFNDPSNGVYQYEYNGLGQAKKTISPKGTKEYIYNNLGQLITQIEISTIDGGQSTNKTISYSYDNKGRIISKSGTSKGQPYSTNITYDQYGRLASSSENSNGKSFIQNEIIYDSNGRVSSYQKQLLSSSIQTSTQIENEYNAWNGALSRIKDKTSGNVLWALTETNAKGQILSGNLGTATITNQYDAYGFLRNIRHSTVVTPSILYINYTFDAIKNELAIRSRLGDFSITEKFLFDNNNRLRNWTNPLNGTLNNVYDIKGRIINNDQVGSIKYENTAKIYQPTGMTLNTSGIQNYTNDLVQSIIFNENNDPVYINGEKGDVAFQYGLTKMRQKVTYGGNFNEDAEGKFTNYYSEDGSFEIIKNNITQEEKHLIYIGGTPYESDIIYLKNFTENSASYKFLHKDYLGSILAISNEAGNKLEQRHYDAWGNLTHLKIGQSATQVGSAKISAYLAVYTLLVNRGYTSHEHFGEVGIIHMNGRLYDPLLKRFLNADENIQDPTNTQNYNKYGYVMNNPLLYNDPNGEFWWWAAGAIAGGYLSGVSANGGNWNPGKWNWESTWSAVLGGAIGGAAVSGTLGNITSNAGAIKSFLPGIVSGGLNSAFTGSNFLNGVIGGISYSGNLFGNSITSTNMFEYSISEMAVNNDNILKESTNADFSIDTVLQVANAHYKNQFIRGSFQLVDETDDLSPYLRGKYSYGGSQNLLVNGNGKNVWGLTEVITHKGTIVWQRIYLPKGTFVSLEQLDLTMGHEIFHSILNNARLFDVMERTWDNQNVSVHEYFTSRWEQKYIMFRGWEKLNLSMGSFHTIVNTFKSFEVLRPKIQPIYNNYLKSTLK